MENFGILFNKIKTIFFFKKNKKFYFKCYKEDDIFFTKDKNLVPEREIIPRTTDYDV